MSRSLDISKVYGIRVETVTNDTVFLSQKVGHLYNWWRSRALGRLPLRREFDILEHRHIVADVFLVEVLPTGEFLMRLEGENVIHLFGVNNSGRLVGETIGLGAYGDALAEYYLSIVDEKRCMRCVGDLEQVNRRRWVEFESIDCPLSRDGSQVDFIIGVIDTVQGKPLR